MKQHQTTIGHNDEWLTPKWILDKLGEFDLDPCASIVRPWDTAKEHLTIQDDSLSMEWYGRVWLNPPFNRYLRPKFMKKMSEHGNGIMLVPAACETVAFKKYVWGKSSGVLMLHSRPHFCDTRGVAASANSGCTICLVAYGEGNFQALRYSELGVCLRRVF